MPCRNCEYYDPEEYECTLLGEVQRERDNGDFEDIVPPRRKAGGFEVDCCKNVHVIFSCQINFSISRTGSSRNITMHPYASRLSSSRLDTGIQ